MHSGLLFEHLSASVDLKAAASASGEPSSCEYENAIIAKRNRNPSIVVNFNSPLSAAILKTIHLNEEEEEGKLFKEGVCSFSSPPCLSPVVEFPPYPGTLSHAFPLSSSFFLHSAAPSSALSDHSLSLPSLSSVSLFLVLIAFHHNLKKSDARFFPQWQLLRSRDGRTDAGKKVLQRHSSQKGEEEFSRSFRALSVDDDRRQKREDRRQKREGKGELLRVRVS